MDRLVTGILAHVDAGKTTLSEGMLYLAGSKYAFQVSFLKAMALNVREA